MIQPNFRVIWQQYKLCNFSEKEFYSAIFDEKIDGALVSAKPWWQLWPILLLSLLSLNGVDLWANLEKEIWDLDFSGLVNYEL